MSTVERECRPWASEKTLLSVYSYFWDSDKRIETHDKEEGTLALCSSTV